VSSAVFFAIDMFNSVIVLSSFSNVTSCHRESA
jgi:hypothetical protein